MDYDAWQKVMVQLRTEIGRIVHMKDQPTGLLYHYTGSDGVLGILKSKTIRLTHFKFLNDPREIIAGVELAQETLRSVCESAKKDSVLGPFVKRSGASFAEESLVEQDIFVGSFSEDGDDLNQWKGYGQNGTGYSIGFRFNVADVVPDPTKDAALAQCVYEQANVRKQFEDVIRVCAKAFEVYCDHYALQCHEPSEPVHDVYRETSVGMLMALAIRALRYKTEHYKSETEWRLYQAHAPNGASGHTEFRSKPGHIVPYVEIPISEETCTKIDRIIVGPNGDSALRVMAMQRLVQAMGLDCEVEPSRIAYRPL